MEQMEQALQQLFSKNESLLVECDNLKLANQKLQQENLELCERLQGPCPSCAQAQNRSVGCETPNGSTERKSHASSSCFEPTPDDSLAENRTELPSLPDLLDELDTDVDLNSLEQLTQSLLQDIARDLEATAQKTDSQESRVYGDSSAEMVGQTPTELESSRSSTTDTKSLESDISEYLLLHHNYAAKPPQVHPTKSKQTITRNKKFKCIRPKSTRSQKIEPASVQPESEIIYGTLDEVNNVVTIIVDSDGVPVAEDALQRLETTTQNTEMLTVPSPIAECLSPMSCSDSDRGYESLDSPVSLPELPEDIWDQSISELFPSLL